MLGLPNKVPYADFLARYSIVAPKIFADMKDDPKGCANKALPAAGLDPDDFRTGHTKVRRELLHWETKRKQLYEGMKSGV